MAKDKTGVTAGVMGTNDGYLYVRSLEDKRSNEYLSVYGAIIEGYKVEPGENYTSVTMKLSFPLTNNRDNVNLWTYFIATSMHFLPKKVFIVVEPAQQGLVAYCRWNIFNDVRYMESKGRSNSGW